MPLIVHRLNPTIQPTRSPCPLSSHATRDARWSLRLRWPLLLRCFTLICLTLGTMHSLAQQTNPTSNKGPLQSEQASALPWTGERITLSLRDADLAETLRNFAKIGDFNLVLDPSIVGKVNVELRDVPWDQALDQILKAHGLGTDIVGGQRLIASPLALADQRQQLSSIRQVELRLRHASPTSVKQLLRRPEGRMLTEQGTVTVEEGGILVLRDRVYQLQRLGPLLQQLDRKGAETESEERLAARADEIWGHEPSGDS